MPVIGHDQCGTLCDYKWVFLLDYKYWAKQGLEEFMLASEDKVTF